MFVSQEFGITVKWIDNSYAEVKVYSNTPMGEVARTVLREKGNPGHGIYLIKEGHYLQSDKTVAECGIQEDDTLEAVVSKKFENKSFVK